MKPLGFANVFTHLQFAKGFFFFFYTKDVSVLFLITLGYDTIDDAVPIVFISLLLDSEPSLSHC